MLNSDRPWAENNAMQYNNDVIQTQKKTLKIDTKGGFIVKINLLHLTFNNNIDNDSV